MIKRKLLSAIGHHWRLKIYAFLIGCALWFYVLSVSGEKERFFQTVPLRIARGVKIEVRPPHSGPWQVTPPTVDIYFVSRGKASRKASLPSDKLFLALVNPDECEQKESEIVPVVVSSSDDVAIIRVEPEKVLVHRRKP
ncbi:MAG TPA: hypothetical protein PKX93_06470 [bacterium]|nr:hypothetical protein [bacterium]HOL67082.1 hypothetical protein [bacterium]HPP11864.1 hypothetical protein [bacterium]